MIMNEQAIGAAGTNGSASSSAIDLCIVGGAGHVGLPLALSFAEAGLSVLVQDINGAALSEIGAGTMPFAEEGGEALLRSALAAGRLTLSTDTADIPPGVPIVITIGTPVDEFLNPVHKEVRTCLDGLVDRIGDDALILLRSTVYPGTTAWVGRHLAAAGKHPLVAFCPERAVQGKAIKELAEMPQLIGGTTPAATTAARQLFEKVAPEIVELPPMEAEFVKLFDNCYRYIEFAISNEFFMIANAAGADYRRILDGMRRNYPRAKDMPSAGFAAGPCLFKDTMQLAAFASNRFNLGHSAMLVNEGLVLYVIERLRERHPLNEMTVGLLGMAFKADSDDTRASLSYKMKKELALHAAGVLTTDPHVTDDADLRPLDEVLADSDVLVLCVPHTAYAGLDTGDTPVVDIWDFLDTESPIL
jgi:UDP-N-acetyl-D-mannosaminuronic acid dehydrogenase